MIGLSNRDSSFFYVKSSDADFEEFITDDVISLSIEDDYNRMMSGTIQLNDPEHYYSAIFRPGFSLNISYGYKSPDLAPSSLTANIENPMEVFGPLERKNIKAVFMSPGGNATNAGQVTMNINFFGYEFLTDRTNRIFDFGTRSNLVMKVMTDMGISIMFINFARGFEVLNRDTAVRQNTSHYRFLFQCAMEWRAIFKVGYNQLGQKVGIFVNPQYIDKIGYVEAVTAAIGSQVTLDWQDGLRNVLEYSWQNHVGEGGAGDNVRITMDRSGNPVFYRYIQEGETVVGYTLNYAAVKKKMDDQPDIKAKFDTWYNYVTKVDFPQLVKEKIFIRTSSTTAPQGIGYSLKCKMLGNPLVIAPMRVKFGKGFPDLFNNSQVSYMIRRVSHTIDRSGYFCELDIVDFWTMSGGSMI